LGLLRSELGEIYAIRVLISYVDYADACEFYNYSRWEQLSEQGRLGYIAGAIDALTSIAGPEQARAALHYRECIERSDMNLFQQDTNVKAYVRTQPAFQAGGMPNALLRYLIALCGLPPKQ
jgi:hypothetical protein